MRSASIFTFILVCLIAIPLPVVARPFQIVTLEQPPIVFEQNGEIKGIAADIVREVFHRLQIPVVIKTYPFARSLYLMESQHADMLFAVVKTPERELYMNYSSEILLEQKAVLFARSDDAIMFSGDFSWMSHFTFGILRKATYGEKWSAAVKSGEVKKVEAVTDYRQNLHKLINKRIDIMIGPRFTILHLIQQEGLNGQIEELSPAIESVPTYLTFSIPLLEEQPELKPQVDDTIKALREEGIIDDIIRSYIH